MKKPEIRSPALKKYGKFIVVLEILAAVIFIKDLTASRTATKTIERPAAGEGEADENLTLRSGEMKEDVAFTVSAKKLTEKEEREHLAVAKKELDETIIGKNESADSIWRKLTLPETCADGFVTASYSFEPGDFIDPDGTVHATDVSGSANVTCEAKLECGDRSEVYLIPLRVVEPDARTPDGLLMLAKDALATADAAGGSEVKIPEKAGGQAISLTVPMQFRGLEFGILGLALVPVLLFVEKKQAADAIRKRNTELTSDYAPIASKLALFTGAGIRPREAFKRIAGSYEKNRRRGAPPSAGYEEIKKTVIEMGEGVGELDAYLRLGDRADHRDYRRLVLMLTQNLQKGDEHLAAELAREETDAFEARKNIALKKGEEASTKLVFPMILLLGSVVGILMLPAFMGMGL